MDDIKRQIYEFLKENLSIQIKESSGRDYLYAGEGLAEYKNITVKLMLRNPETGEEEVIGEENFSM